MANRGIIDPYDCGGNEGRASKSCSAHQCWTESYAAPPVHPHEPKAEKHPFKYSGVFDLKYQAHQEHGQKPMNQPAAFLFTSARDHPLPNPGGGQKDKNQRTLTTTARKEC